MSLGRTHGRRYQVASTIVVGLALMGCGEEPTRPAADGRQHIANVARLLGEYAARHGDRLPTDAAAFDAYLESLPDEQRRQLAGDEIGSIYRSPRDAEEYIVLWGQSVGDEASGPRLHGEPLVVAESVGVDNRRLVANVVGVVEELDRDQVDRMLPWASPLDR